MRLRDRTDRQGVQIPIQGYYAVQTVWLQQPDSGFQCSCGEVAIKHDLSNNYVWLNLGTSQIKREDEKDLLMSRANHHAFNCKQKAWCPLFEWLTLALESGLQAPKIFLMALPGMRLFSLYFSYERTFIPLHLVSSLVQWFWHLYGSSKLVEAKRQDRVLQKEVISVFSSFGFPASSEPGTEYSSSIHLLKKWKIES